MTKDALLTVICPSCGAPLVILATARHLIAGMTCAGCRAPLVGVAPDPKEMPDAPAR